MEKTPQEMLKAYVDSQKSSCQPNGRAQVIKDMPAPVSVGVSFLFQFQIT